MREGEIWKCYPKTSEGIRGGIIMILVTLVMSLQVMYSGSHKDFFPEKSDYCLLPKNKFLR
jgi:hypothetical protein